MPLSIARKLTFAGLTVGVLLAVLTWTAQRAARTTTQLARATELSAIVQAHADTLATAAARAQRLVDPTLGGPVTPLVTRSIVIDDLARAMASLDSVVAADSSLAAAVAALRDRVMQLGFTLSGPARDSARGEIVATRRAGAAVALGLQDVQRQREARLAIFRVDALARASRTRTATRLVWLAAILLTGVGFYFFRSDVHARRDTEVDSSTRKQHEDELRALSLVDDLTGLNNRRGFLALAQQQIKLARRNKRELVLLFVDMDDFKQINDAHGHQEGDVALQRAARVLRATFRDSDIIARLGGDEFVVLAADTGSSASIVQRLRRELYERNEHDGYPYMLSFSVGAARFDPEDPPTIEELLQTADSMLYEQKRHRRQTHAIAD